MSNHVFAAAIFPVLHGVVVQFAVVADYSTQFAATAADYTPVVWIAAAAAAASIAAAAAIAQKAPIAVTTAA